MSHEFRTPLHGIGSFAALGLKKVDSAPPDKLRTYFESIIKSGNRLGELVNDLLDLAKLESGKLDFRFMQAFDGITDITASPYFAQLDAMYPDAKFVLTLRDEETWLRSCHNHWLGRDPFEVTSSRGREIHLQIRRFLRAATYGTYRFEPERFRWVYRQHVAAVRRYFADRPGKLLELDIVSGSGWGPLCEFLGRPMPDQPFPHKGGVLTARLEAEVDDPDD